ncbi:MAG: hypothetical protein ACPGLY_11880, partial [Rubripirellula sp.]
HSLSWALVELGPIELIESERRSVNRIGKTPREALALGGLQTVQPINARSSDRSRSQSNVSTVAVV